MAVPADIRAVPRPKNTIVDDSGRDGPKRYAVRERASTKYVSGGNPQPRNGKVVGHIINYEYIPVDTEIKSAPVVPDMLSYGSSALVHSVTIDIEKDLLAVYDPADVFAIMSVATLRVIKPSITAPRNVGVSPNRRIKRSLNPSDLVVAQERMLTSLPEIYSPADWETFISSIIIIKVSPAYCLHL